MAWSMTGYGHGTAANDAYAITIDLRAVNHRYLELYFKIPRQYSFLEDRLRRELTTRLGRGKLEITVTLEKLLPDQTRVELNRPLAASYLNAISQLQTEFNLTGTVDLPTLLALPNLWETIQPELDQQQLEEVADNALNSALHELLEMRSHEGEALVADLKQKLTVLSGYRKELLQLAPQAVLDYQQRLLRRIPELADGVELDPSRLNAEVALLADKTDISEELVRIENHLLQLEQSLAGQVPVGRRLDFIIQELNREINTIGSKANQLRISQLVIDFKVELEKIREQIQNLE